MHLLDVLIRPFAPHHCIACAEPGCMLCRRCANDNLTPLAPTCYRCNALTPGFKMCSRCRPRSALARLIAPYSYEGTAAELVRALKYRGKREAAVTIGSLLAANVVEPYTIVTWVPTATRRRRQRGYDHAELIAKQVARERSLPCLPLLAKVTQTRQVGAGRQLREKQARESYRLRQTKPLRGKRILIIDDVVSTGASLEACAALLRKAGAKVDGATFARRT
jgi:ComF family protein